MLTSIQRVRLQRLRWAAFLLVGSAYVLSFFHRMAPGAISAELQQAFQASGTGLGFLAASYFYIYTVMQVPTGLLADTLGVRRVVTLGGLIAGAGSILFGVAPSLGLAALGRTLVGLGVSVMFIAMLKINALWFRERHFGTVTGLTVLVGNLGAVLAAAPLVWLLEVVSWRTVFIAAGWISIALAALTWMVIRDTPAEAGLPSMRELDGLAPHPSNPGRWWHGLIEVGRNRATWAPFLPAFGVAGTLLAFAGLWAVPFLHDAHGLTRAEAAMHTSFQLIGFAVGAMFTGAISDRLGRRRSVMVGGIWVYLACWVPLVLLVPLAAPWSHLLFLTMGLGASGFTLAWSIAKEVNRPALSGTATSVVNTGVFLGTALLQPLLGWLMDQQWDGRIAAGARVYPAASYQLGLGVLFLLSVVGLIGALLSRETRCRYVTT